MSDDLVMRLRSNPTYDDISDAADLIDNQQDRIAQLEATLREILDAEMDAIVKRILGAKVAGGKDE